MHLHFSSEYGSIYFWFWVQTIIIMTSWTRLINCSNNKWNIFFYWIVFCKSSFRGTCELWSIPIYTFYLYTLIKSTVPIHHPTISFSKKKKKKSRFWKRCNPISRVALWVRVILMCELKSDDVSKMLLEGLHWVFVEFILTI